MNSKRKPDLVLALLYLEVCLGSAIPLGIVGRSLGVIWFASIPLAYVVLESINCARPLAGLALGAYAFFLWVLGFVVGEVPTLGAPYGTKWWELLTVIVVPATAGALFGLVVSSLTLLARRLRHKNPDGKESRSVPERLRAPVPIAVVLAVVPFLESVLMTLQWDLNGAIQSLLKSGYNTVGWRLLSLDRPALVLISGLAAYAVLKKRRWLRAAVPTYLVVGVVLTAIHLAVGVHLDGSIVLRMAPESGYVYANLNVPFYPVVLSDYIRACGIEVAVRTVLCGVGIPWIFISSIKSKSPNDAG